MCYDYINDDVPTPNHQNDDDDDDDEDDIDDRVNVIINNDEEARLQKIINEPSLYELNLDDDVELKTEINNIVQASINPPKGCKLITVSIFNQLISIPVNLSISSRLASIIWEPACCYKASVFPFMNSFNAFLLKYKNDDLYPDNIKKSEPVAIFAARYKKNNGFSTNSKVKNYKVSDVASTSTETDRGTAVNGLYYYHDFAIVIIVNGIVVDYAIHGFQSNISDIIYKYKPQRVYYNAVVGDALDSFLNYPFQPFYAAMKNLLHPVKIYRPNDSFLAFCNRGDLFCALCNALRDTKGILLKRIYTLVPASEKLPNTNINNSNNHCEQKLTFHEKMKRINFIKLNSYKQGLNKLHQPTHNMFRHKIKPAPKRLGRYTKRDTRKFNGDHVKSGGSSINRHFRH